MIRHKFLAFGALLPLLVAGCALTSQADDPVVLKLNDLERRLGAIERVLASGSLIELTVQSDELQRQASDLQGRTEILEHDAEGTAKRQRDLYAGSARVSTRLGFSTTIFLTWSSVSPCVCRYGMNLSSRYAYPVPQ